MFINKNFVFLLPFLYFSSVSCFHKHIPPRSSVLCKSSRSNIVLPDLTDQDKRILAAGEMIEKQERNGSKGRGLVVVDIQFSPEVVFETLTQFAMYQNMIPIVKSSTIISSDGVTTRAEYVFTRFFLRVNVKHTVLQQQRIVKFTLDPNRVNPVFREADGFWHVEIPTDRPEGYCRVYLIAQIITHKGVPTVLIDYAATTALSRATKWLKPFFENSK